MTFPPEQECCADCWHEQPETERFGAGAPERGQRDVSCCWALMGLTHCVLVKDCDKSSLFSDKINRLSVHFKKPRRILVVLCFQLVRIHCTVHHLLLSHSRQSDKVKCIPQIYTRITFYRDIKAKDKHVTWLLLQKWVS